MLSEEDKKTCQEIEEILKTQEEELNSEDTRALFEKFGCSNENPDYVEAIFKIQRSHLDQLNKLGIEIHYDEKQFLIWVNCFLFALRLMHSEKYQRMYNEYAWEKKYQEQLVISSDFINDLLENNYLPECLPVVGCIVLYFNNENKPCHAAILIKNADSNLERVVEGRWGTNPAKFIHKINHRPLRYGTKHEPKFYRALTQEQSEQYVEDYLKKQKISVVV